MKKLLIALIVVSLVSGMLFAAGQQEVSKGKVVLKLATIYAPDHPVSIGLDNLVKTVAAESGGRLEIQHFPAAQLGNEPSIHEGLRNYTIDMAVMGISEVGKRFEPVLVFDAPFIFRDADHMMVAFNSDTGNKLWSEFENKTSIKMMAPIYYGTRILTTTKPVPNVATLKGMKIRVPDQPNSVDTWKALGATPTPMNLGEVYLSLQTGVVDGTIWGNLEIHSRKFPTKRSTISAGIFGATSLIFDKAGKTQFDFKPDVSLRYNLYSTVDWTLHIQNDDALKISTKVGKDFLKYWQSELSIAYTTGGIHPENLRSSFSGTVYRDRSVDSYLALSFIYAEKFLLRGVANLDYIWYGHQDFGDSNLIHSYQIESLYSTLPFGFFPNRGFRFDLSALAEVIPHFGYKIESRIQSAIPIGANDVIGIDIHAGSAFTNQRRKSAYFDYGGLRSIVTYPVTTLTDQMVTAQLKHTHTLKEQPIFIALRSTLAAGVKGTILNEAGSSASLGDLPPVPFSQLKSWDFSASVALGLSFATIDLLFGVAIDNNLKVALFLEVI